MFGFIQRECTGGALTRGGSVPWEWNPMPGVAPDTVHFVHLLGLSRTGEVSEAELLDEVDRQLSKHESAPGGLIASLNGEHARSPLPGRVHAVLMRRLLRHSFAAGDAEDSGAIPLDRSATDDDATTTLIDHTEADNTNLQALPVSPGLAVGDLLKGRFRLIGHLGEGGMSTVYNAIDLRKVEARAADAQVAVKILAVTAYDPTQSLKTLQAEAQTLQRLPHPNIVRVIDCDRDGDTVFMTMEHLTGESLKAKMADRDGKGLPATEAVSIIRGIADGLAYAHRNGIVHGDLKPSNVIVTGDGSVKIIDFGISRLIKRDQRAPVDTEDPTFSALTPTYASPEMLESGKPDRRNDIYALACMAHELLTGRHPFDRTVANEARDSGQKLVRRRALTSAQFNAIAHGLNFDRGARTPSVEQFVAEFEASARMRSRSIAAITLGLMTVAVVLAAILVHFLDARNVTSSLNARLLPITRTPRLGEQFRDCSTCPLMKVLPPGGFSQGAPLDRPGGLGLDRPRHSVVIRYPFAMSEYEVTVGEFQEFASATSFQGYGCASYDGSWKVHPELNWNDVGYKQTATHPVVCLSWREATDYAKWLSQSTGQKYRLPSESEWEYAARAGADAATPWGDIATAACGSANIADETAAHQFPGWEALPCSDGYVYTAPVGSFTPNAFGLYDMLGNAFEWVQDCWHPNYQGAPSDGSAWMSGECAEHPLRGGSWFTSPEQVGTSARNRFEEGYRSNSVGFRLVREITK
jgi:formylglycine-generating enzyme required for sulfatase activity/tRNA A-37 threonylcarbamoyl transferase component Bud32